VEDPISLAVSVLEYKRGTEKPLNRVRAGV